MNPANNLPTVRLPAASYLSWREKTLAGLSGPAIDAAYNEGCLFTRLGRGVMHETRSLRIDLAKFELTSENRRVLRKTDGLSFSPETLPYRNYTWTIGKLAKDFYDKKFGAGTFSANKMRALLTDGKTSNFNRLLVYTFTYQTSPKMLLRGAPDSDTVGYCVARETGNLLHYCYPFYNLESGPENLGLGMMLRAIVWAKEKSKKHVYLGSAQRQTDVYKLQFSGLEWWDGKSWQTDINRLKLILQKGQAN